MRKFYSLVMLVAVILLASCIKEDLDGVSSGSERNVRFTVDLPHQGAETRAAYTDPELKDMRVVLMVLEDGKVLTSESKTHTFEGNDGLAFDVALVTGKTYKVAVWADFGETYYRLTSETGSEPSVAMASTNITGSNNLYDAYFAIQEVTLTETDRNISMSLKRPFALVKINTEDYDKPTVASKYLPKYYATEIEVPVSMSLVNGAVSETGTVTIQSNNRETGNIADVKATGELSYDYFFAGENQANLKDFTVTYSNENGKIVDYTFTNIPFRRNYRTNITGNILTKTGTIDVSINQDWDGSFPQIGSAEEFVEAIRNAQNGDIIQLASNITLTDPISLDWGDGVEVRVDLNGQQLTFAEGEPNDITVKSGVLRMTNGTIVGDKAGMMDGCIAAISTGGVELENVKYTTRGCALFAGDEGRIVVKNSTVTAGVYGITSNASNPDQNISVTLERSTFTGASPIMLNVPSTIVVEECRITGTTQGMVVRGGTATIGNSTITLEYGDEDYNEIIHYFDNRNWGSGNVLTCAALTIGNKAPGVYQYPTHVTLKNTELKLGGQYGAYFPALYAHANEGEGLGVTLNFDEQCKFDKMPEYGSTNILVNGTAPIADESGKTYASVAEAVEAVTPESRIVLAPGLYQGDTDLKIGKALTLEGNNAVGTVTFENNIIIAGNVTLKNLSMNSTTGDAIHVETSDIILNVEGVTVNKTGGSSCISISEAEGVKLNVKNSNLIVSKSNMRGVNCYDLVGGNECVVNLDNTHIGPRAEILGYGDYTDEQNEVFKGLSDTRGIGVGKNEAGLEVNIKNNSVIEGVFYAVNVIPAAGPVNVNVENSTLDGRCAFNLWGRNESGENKFVVSNSKLVGRNPFGGPTENFATIVFNWGQPSGFAEPKNNRVVVENSEIYCYNNPETGTNTQLAADMRSWDTNILELKGNTVIYDRSASSRLEYAVDIASSDNSCVVDETVRFLDRDGQPKNKPIVKQ